MTSSNLPHLAVVGLVHDLVKGGVVVYPEGVYEAAPGIEPVM